MGTKPSPSPPSEEDQASNECTVCLEPVESPQAQNGAEASCGHVFHIDCIAPWLERENRTCPNCRQELDDDFRSRVEALASENPPGSIVSLRFSIHIPDDLEDSSPDVETFNEHLEHDLELLHELVEDEYEAGLDWVRLGWGWVWSNAVNTIVARYRTDGYPRTDYVTTPTLLRLTVVAALVDHIQTWSGRESITSHRERQRENNAYRALGNVGSRLLVVAQREATREGDGTPAYREYMRILDHPDNLWPWNLQRGPVWRHRGVVILDADRWRAEWVITLRRREGLRHREV